MNLHTCKFVDFLLRSSIELSLVLFSNNLCTFLSCTRASAAAAFASRFIYLLQISICIRFSDLTGVCMTKPWVYLCTRSVIMARRSMEANWWFDVSRSIILMRLYSNTHQEWIQLDCNLDDRRKHCWKLSSRFTETRIQVNRSLSNYGFRNVLTFLNPYTHTAADFQFRPDAVTSCPMA